MANILQVTIGQATDKGRKEVNQDFHGAYIPEDDLIHSKGVAVALADGISSSNVSHVASQSAVAGFLNDYYCTPDAWSVKHSAQRVLRATNSWLHAQTRQSHYHYERERGYVCTFSALVLKSTTAYIFHVGDSRIYRLHDNKLEQLTEDHRVYVSREQSYLGRALGVNRDVEIDYRTLPLERGDTFLLATDGVYEYLCEKDMVQQLHDYHGDLNRAAAGIVNAALEHGSKDNLTVQVVRIEALPEQSSNEVYQRLTQLPFPPPLEPRMTFDGYEILRELHISNRSHVYLVRDLESNLIMTLKIPSIELRNDPAYLEQFLMEEWVARRVNSAHTLKTYPHNRPRHYLYSVAEYVEGQTLTQWMIDHPHPELETVRSIVEQVGRGLRALHRMDMLHQDLRPSNIMIDRNNIVKIIDFGSVRVAGVQENASPVQYGPIPGTVQYMAPEYFLGETGTVRSDLFSLGVITYQMLCGRLPYGAAVAKARTRAEQRRLTYSTVLADESDIPVWVDEALKKAVHPNPDKRYGELSEFLYDLRNPNAAFVSKRRVPLLERNPVRVWQGVSLMLALLLLVMSVR